MRYTFYYLATYTGKIFHKIYSVVRILYWKLKYPGLSISLKCYVGFHTSLKVIKGAKVVLGKICIQKGATIFAEKDSNIEIGDDVYIGHYTIIAARDKIKIGKGTQIAEFVTIRDQNHTVDLKGFTSSPIEIGSKVWLGAKVTITENVKIGDNCIIGAHSFVNKSFEKPCLIGGIPASVIRFF